MNRPVVLSIFSRRTQKNGPPLIVFCPDTIYRTKHFETFNRDKSEFIAFTAHNIKGGLT